MANATRPFIPANAARALTQRELPSYRSPSLRTKDERLKSYSVLHFRGPDISYASSPIGELVKLRQAFDSSGDHLYIQRIDGSDRVYVRLDSSTAPAIEVRRGTILTRAFSKLYFEFERPTSQAAPDKPSRRGPTRVTAIVSYGPCVLQDSTDNAHDIAGSILGHRSIAPMTMESVFAGPLSIGAIEGERLYLESGKVRIKNKSYPGTGIILHVKGSGQLSTTPLPGPADAFWIELVSQVPTGLGAVDPLLEEITFDLSGGLITYDALSNEMIGPLVANINAAAAGVYEYEFTALRSASLRAPEIM